MAAAVALAESGLEVTVFESAKQPGGRARGVLHGGTQLDNGQHILLGCYRQTLNLIEKVGGNVEDDFLRTPLQLDLNKRFSLKAPRLPAPLHLLAALLGARGIGMKDRIDAISFMSHLKSIHFRLDADIAVIDLLAFHNQSRRLIEHLWEPLCIAALNTPMEIASAQLFLNVIRDAFSRSREDSDMLLPRIDFTQLFPRRAASYLESRGGRVFTSCGVESIEPLENAIKVVSKNGGEEFSHVICATSPTVAAKLLGRIPGLQETARQIDALQHQPIYTVYLQYPHSVSLPHPMLGLYRRCSQWLFDKGEISGQHGLIASVISAEGLHQELSHEELAEKVAFEISEEFGIRELPLWHKVIAEKRATFACTPNLSRPGQQTSLPRFFLAGDYTKGDYPATLEGAVQSGLACARLIEAGS